MTPLHFRTPLTDRQIKRLVRRFKLAQRIGDMTWLNDDGTVRKVFKGSRGWRRAWLKLRLWLA